MKQTAVEFLVDEFKEKLIGHNLPEWVVNIIQQAKAMDKEQMLDFGEFIIDELAPMAQNREWVEERYNYYKSE
jgi:hypothetical protein